MVNKRDQHLHLFKAQGRLRSSVEEPSIETPQHGNLHFIQSLIAQRVNALQGLDNRRRLEFKLLSYPSFRVLETKNEPHIGPLYAVASKEIDIQKKILSWLEDRATYLQEKLQDLETQMQNAEEHWKKWKNAKDTTLLQKESKIMKREHYKIKKAITETSQSLNYLEALENEWRRELLGISSV